MAFQPIQMVKSIHSPCKNYIDYKIKFKYLVKSVKSLSFNRC